MCWWSAPDRRAAPPRSCWRRGAGRSRSSTAPRRARRSPNRCPRARASCCIPRSARRGVDARRLLSQSTATSRTGPARLAATRDRRRRLPRLAATEFDRVLRDARGRRPCADCRRVGPARRRRRPDACHVVTRRRRHGHVTRASSSTAPAAPALSPGADCGAPTRRYRTLAITAEWDCAALAGRRTDPDRDRELRRRLGMVGPSVARRVGSAR